ncbi:glutamyl-tRNA reductase [Bradyrhizobium sp. GM22.5]
MLDASLKFASSAHSQILGESFVSHQLAKSIELVHSKFPISQVAQLAFDIGRAARERHGFIASFNYDQIVRDIVADRFADGERPDRLYVIGAGMLGRGLIRSGVGERFRSTVVVTRNPKALRKRLRHYPDIEVALLRPEEIGQEREPCSIVVIATADIDDGYEAILQNGLLRLEPRTIVDLSSVPALSDIAIRKLSYVNMYSEEFLRFIEQNNAQLAPKLPLVFSDIEATFRTMQIHLAAKAT